MVGHRRFEFGDAGGLSLQRSDQPDWTVVASEADPRSGVIVPVIDARPSETGPFLVGPLPDAAVDIDDQGAVRLGFGVAGRQLDHPIVGGGVW